MVLLAIIAAAAIIFIFKEDELASDVTKIAADIRQLRLDVTAAATEAAFGKKDAWSDAIEKGSNTKEGDRIRPAMAEREEQEKEEMTERWREAETAMKELTTAIGDLDQTLKDEAEERSKTKKTRKHRGGKGGARGGGEGSGSPEGSEQKPAAELTVQKISPAALIRVNQELIAAAQLSTTILGRMDEHLGYLNVRLGDHEKILSNIEKEIGSSVERIVDAVTDVKDGVVGFKESFEVKLDGMMEEEKVSSMNETVTNHDMKVELAVDEEEENVTIRDVENERGEQNAPMAISEAPMTSWADEDESNESSWFRGKRSTQGRRRERETGILQEMLEAMKEIRNASVRIGDDVDWMKNDKIETVNQTEAIRKETRERMTRRWRRIWEMSQVCSKWKPYCAKAIPNDLLYFLSGNKLFETKRYTQEEAQQLCERNHGTLANMDSQWKMDAIDKIT